MNIFISYSSKDFDTASKACEVMEDNGFPCFIAPRNIRTGHVYAEEIIFGLKNSDVLVLMLTENSNASAHVMREVEWCVSNNVPIIAYRLEDVELSPSMEYFLMSTQWLEGQNDKGFEDLVDSLYGMQEDLAAEAGLKQAEEEDDIKYTEADAEYDEETETQKAALMSDLKNSEAEHENIKRKKKTRRIWKWIVVAACIICFLFVLVVFGTILLVKVAKGLDEKATTAQKTSEQVSEPKPWTTEEDTEFTTEDGEEDSQSGTGHKNNSFVLGSLVVLGTYDDEPIEWRVFHANADGTVDLITDQIICCKAFDGAESGRAYFDNNGEMVGETHDFRESLVQAYGNSSWISSNIRIWLNSPEARVSYLGQKPTDASMYEGTDGYEAEAGFLTGFTDEERKAIVQTVREVEYYDAGADVLVNNQVYDTVRLLCVDELDRLPRAGVDTFVCPTDRAMATDAASYYRDYFRDEGMGTLDWWLMDSTNTGSFKAGVVTTGAADRDKIEGREPFMAGIGVRPVITVNPALVP